MDIGQTLQGIYALLVLLRALTVLDRFLLTVLRVVKVIICIHSLVSAQQPVLWSIIRATLLDGVVLVINLAQRVLGLPTRTVQAVFRDIFSNQTLLRVLTHALLLDTGKILRLINVCLVARSVRHALTQAAIRVSVAIKSSIYNQLQAAAIRLAQKRDIILIIPPILAPLAMKLALLVSVQIISTVKHVNQDISCNYHLPILYVWILV